jgi:hypothetical protein
MRLGLHDGRRSRFCSAENRARPSDGDGRLTDTGPRFSPGGVNLSRPRPRLRPGARDAPSASGPVDRFSASDRLPAGNAEYFRVKWAAGRFRLRAGFPAGERGDNSRERAVGRFYLRAEFRSEQ